MAMARAIAAWLEQAHLEPDGPLKLPYTRYGSLLLLSTTAFRTPEWCAVRERCTPHDQESLYALVAKHLQITHIAINAPIPATIDHDVPHENTLRAPQNFRPAWGDFGPETCHTPPAPHDLDAAFWVTAKQNAIYQVWAPRWTMFSRGNITEKARLLNLASVELAVAQGKADGKGCSAVDLYAGIGYFAFSYLKAGVDRVLCWDINPWSIEGLRRGASVNQWSTTTYIDGAPLESLLSNHARVLVFNETNHLAAERVQCLGDRLPPVRHVNCGLLPTSRPSWHTALAVLDCTLGGWIHVHENFDVNNVQHGAEGVRTAFQDMVGFSSPDDEVKIEAIHCVKSYAPGVMHCVIDISIPALRPS